jgi:predicted AAA+ superfamily ATPase
MELFGFLFESLVIRDLRVYAQANDADVFHYRDNTGLEVDAIVEAQDCRWAAFEVKLGQSAIDEASRTLRRFAARIDTKKCGEPAMLGVITGNGFAYVRPDGVAVIPIGSLGP